MKKAKHKHKLNLTDMEVSLLGMALSSFGRNCLKLMDDCNDEKLIEYLFGEDFNKAVGQQFVESDDLKRVWINSILAGCSNVIDRIKPINDKISMELAPLKASFFKENENIH